MIANYHTHTPRCGHASGEEKEYVEEAIRGGLKILGFSDHAPVPYKGGYSSPGVRMDVSEIEDYVDAVMRVKDEYRRDIEIHLGFEMEYYPGYIDAQLDLYRQYPIDFFLLGQHYLGDEIGCPYCGRHTEDRSVLTGYCSQTAEALKTGLFTYFAHPDLVGNKPARHRDEPELPEYEVLENRRRNREYRHPGLGCPLAGKHIPAGCSTRSRKDRGEISAEPDRPGGAGESVCREITGTMQQYRRLPIILLLA